MGKRILLVDDDQAIVKGVRYMLEQEGFTTDTAEDGEEALEKFRADPCDLILLDVMLPKMDGMTVCQRIREFSSVPIIMLTAKGDDMDRILGLEYGADDYIPKPFNQLEVVTRVKAVLRRASAAPVVNEERRVITVHELEVNPIKRTVSVAGRDIRLTAKEFDLLLLLIENPGKPFTRKDMLQRVWNYAYDGDDRTVDVHIRRLREKIERDTNNPVYIKTKWGVGYYFWDYRDNA